MLGGREGTAKDLRKRGRARILSLFLLERLQVGGVMGWVGIGLLFCFASLLTVHLAIAVALLGRHPRWRGWLSLVPPAAPLTVYWAFRERMYVRGALWSASAVGYALLLTTAYISP